MICLIKKDVAQWKYPPKKYGLPPGMILVFVLPASGILGGGLLFNRTQEQQLKRISENELAAIARLKMSQIVQWRNERLGNAGYMSVCFKVARREYDITRWSHDRLDQWDGRRSDLC